MAKVLYQALGPLVSGEGSRASLGIEVVEGALPRAVVLFWVPEEVARDSEAAAKIAREVKRASSLAHPNIVKVLGLATLNEGLARVVELVDGESLRKVLDVAGKLPPRLAALVAADAAMGAHHAHVAASEGGTPLLHGDLRPETLWVSFSGVCKVGGYGAQGVAPKEQGALGRRLRCAPEQILGGRHAIDRQTDVYLLGMVLFECLAGQVSSANDPDRDRAALNQTLPRLLASGAPPELIRVVEQATAEKGQDRFPTARALRDAIDRAVGILPAHEELAVFLRGFFPESSPARNTRRREIESAIAELARRESERAQVVSRPTQSPKPANPGEPGLIEIPSAAAAPEPPKPPSAALNPPKERTIATNAVAVLLILAALGYLYLHSMELSEATEGRPVGAASAAVAVTDPPAGIESAGVDPPVRIDSPPAKAAEASAPAPPAAKTTASPSPAAAAALELTVEPPVEIAIDGRAVGRSPVSFLVSPGKHLLQFTDARRGIDVSRPIRVADGRKISQRLVIGRGIVEVSAPDGAAIYIDGKPVGTTPLKEISVYEGKHRILATLGGAKWQQGFVLGADERMSFKIETVEE
jgi:hypothetical protein